MNLKGKGIKNKCHVMHKGEIQLLGSNQLAVTRGTKKDNSTCTSCVVVWKFLRLHLVVS